MFDDVLEVRGALEAKGALWGASLALCMGELDDFKSVK